MTQDQVMGIVRQILPFIGGLAVGKGWLTTSQAAELTTLILQIAGPIFIVVSSIWAYKANSKSSIITSATNMPEVDSKKLAAAISDPELKSAANNPTPVTANEAKK